MPASPLDAHSSNSPANRGRSARDCDGKKGGEVFDANDHLAHYGEQGKEEKGAIFKYV